MTRLLKKDKLALVLKLAELWRTGITQAEAARIVGKSKSSIASLCSREGIIGWPTGAACYDQRGENNPSFKNGLSRATVSRATKRAVVESGRDLFTCERCNIKRVIELPRHHKDRNRANNLHDNVEVLCVSCHNKEHMPERTRDSFGRLLPK